MEAEMTEHIITVLGEPVKPTIVAEQYANSNNYEREVQAYAKIAGKNWTYYVKSLNVSIGRNTSPTGENHHDSAPKSVVGEDDNSKDDVDIDLGPAKVVSRRHASIEYNLNMGIWELNIEGRNGAKVNFTRVQAGPGSPSIQLVSGTIIDIGGTQMMFILPDSSPVLTPNAVRHIQNKIPFDHVLYSLGLPRPANAQTNENGLNNDNPHIRVIPNGNDSQLYEHQSQNLNSLSGNNANQYLASQQQTHMTHQFEANGATMGIIDPGFPAFPNEMTSDLSRPENKNVKPPYSYATMITQAILSTEEGQMSLADIYSHISSSYSYYQFGTSGWQNSIRHNLSLNKAFEKVPRREGEPGKGMKWRVAESFQREFLEKYREGKVSKIKRGSSVVRQLQLHISKFGSLPIERNNSEFNHKLNDNKTATLKTNQSSSKQIKASTHNSTLKTSNSKRERETLEKVTDMKKEKLDPFLAQESSSSKVSKKLKTTKVENGFAAQIPPISTDNSKQDLGTKMFDSQVQFQQQPLQQYSAPLNFNSHRIPLSPNKRPINLANVTIPVSNNVFDKIPSTTNSPTRNGSPLLTTSSRIHQQLQPQHELNHPLNQQHDPQLMNGSPQHHHESMLRSPNAKLFSVSAVEAYTPERGSTIQQLNSNVSNYSNGISSERAAVTRRLTLNDVNNDSSSAPTTTITSVGTGMTSANDTTFNETMGLENIHATSMAVSTFEDAGEKDPFMNNTGKESLANIASSGTEISNNAPGGENVDLTKMHNTNTKRGESVINNVQTTLLPPPPAPILKQTQQQEHTFMHPSSFNPGTQAQMNSGANPQSSPGVWNLLQFSSLNNTPAGPNMNNGRSSISHPLESRSNNGDVKDSNSMNSFNNSNRSNSGVLAGNNQEFDEDRKRANNDAESDSNNTNFDSSPLKRKSANGNGAANDDTSTEGNLGVMLDPNSAKINIVKE